MGRTRGQAPRRRAPPPSTPGRRRGSGLATAPGTSSSPARPLRSRGGTERSATSRHSCRTSRSSASTSCTSRRSIRSAGPTARGRTTPRRPARTTRGARGRSDRRRAATRRSTRSSARSTTSGICSAELKRHGHGARPRPRLPVLARPSLGARAPRVVPAPRRRHDPLRREPAEEVRGHLPSRLRDEGSRGALERAARAWSCSGCEKEVPIFRVDNPHTKPFAFWEWLLAEVKSDHPDVLFLSEAFTRPRVMERPGQDRLRPVLHVLRVAANQAGADRLPDRAHAADRSATSFGRTSGPTPPTSSPTSSKTGGRPAFRLRLSAGGDAGRELRDLRAAVRAHGARAEGAGLGGVSRFREVPAAAPGSAAATGIRELIARVNQIRREQPGACNTTVRCGSIRSTTTR